MATTRKRGSITDTITLDEVPFQYEPVTEFKQSTNYGSQKIIGRRLVNRVWVGTGAGDLTISFTLVGVAHTQLNPTASEVGQYRYNQAVKDNLNQRKQIWVPDKVDGAGHVIVRGHYEANPNYNPKMIDDGSGNLVENPNYVNPVSTVDDTQKNLSIQKQQDNAKAQNLLDRFLQFLEPQPDTGAPHPIYVNMGGAYKGRKFIVTEAKHQITVTNYATLEPMEIVVSMTLSEIPAVVVTPEPVASGTAMTGKGSKTTLVKLPSMMACHRTTLKAKTRRR